MFHALLNGHKYTIHSDHSWVPVNHKMKVEFIKIYFYWIASLAICKIFLKFSSIVSCTIFFLLITMPILSLYLLHTLNLLDDLLVLVIRASLLERH